MMSQKIGKKVFSTLVVVVIIVSYVLYRNRDSIESSLRRFVKEPDDYNDADPLLLHRFLSEASNLEGSELTVERTNPGCVYRRLGYYVPQRSPIVYNHPPIVHYAKFSDKHVTLSYTEYMALLSAYKFLKPEKMFIHSDVDIYGEYWERTQKWTDTLVKVNKVSRMGKINGIKVQYVQHEADYIKMKQLFKYGGVTSDFDVAVVNGSKLKGHQKVSECVLSWQLNVLNIGFTSCIKNASFVRRVLDGYERDYQPSWIYNSNRVTAGILTNERTKCYNVYVDNTICQDPLWSDAPKRWLSNKGVDWRSKTAAHYFVKSGFPNSEEEVLKANHSLAELFQYVNES